MQLRPLRLFLSLTFNTALAFAQAGGSSEQRANHYLEAVRKEPPLALAFLRDMPKGGDLHNHLYGAIYAEDLIDFAAENALCVDRNTSRLIRASCDSCETYR